MVDKYKTSMKERESMIEKIEGLEKENFELRRDLTEKSTVVKYLQEQTKAQTDRLDFLQRENTQLTMRLEYVTK